MSPRFKRTPQTNLGLDTPRGVRLVKVGDIPAVSLTKLGGSIRFIPLAALMLLGVSLGFVRANLSGPPSVVEAAAGGNPDQILVKFKSNASAQAIAALNSSHAIQQVDAIPAIGVRVLRVPSGQAAATVAAAYAHNPLVQFAEPNFTAKALDTVPNDPQLSLNQWNISKIKAPAAWDITTGTASATIAIVDTGIWSGHPDLAGKVLPGYNFIAANTNTTDDNGHGTWVAGVAAADTNNGIGMAGISWGSQLLPVKVCDATGTCTYANIANGITWAADHGAKVINLSLGGTSACGSTLQSAADYAWSKGAVIVAASGNETASSVDAPANCSHVLAVGATDSSDVRASWSNYGSALALTAPGVTIVCPSLSGSYGGCTGTSFASPHVAGVAALLVSKGATNASTASALTAGVDDLGSPGWDQYYGAGRLNAYKALLVLGTAPVPTATLMATSTPTATSTMVMVPTATKTPLPATATATKTPSIADTTPPSVALTAPGQSQALKGNANASATASDNVGVARVDFYVDGKLLKSVITAPYTATWNTRKWSNGGHTVSSKAYDAAGNVASDSHSVLVSN